MRVLIKRSWIRKNLGVFERCTNLNPGAPGFSYKTVLAQLQNARARETASLRRLRVSKLRVLGPKGRHSPSRRCQPPVPLHTGMQAWRADTFISVSARWALRSRFPVIRWLTPPARVVSCLRHLVERSRLRCQVSGRRVRCVRPDYSQARRASYEVALLLVPEA